MTNKKHIPNSPSLFISSPFRSGSALLSRTLNTHSQIALLNDDIKYFRFIYSRYLPLREDNIIKMLNDISYRLLKRFNMKLDVKSCLSTIQQQPIDEASIYSTLLNYFLGDQQKKLIGEMESVSWTNISVFLNMYPEAKGLLIIRDLRDVVVSFKKKTIAPGYDYLIALFNVIDAMDHYLEYQESFPERFYGVSFELLKENPEREITKICLFLDLEYEAGMIVEENWTDYHGDKWKNRQISSFYKDADSMNPVGRWRRLITPEELYLCEWIGCKQMKAFNMQFEGELASQEVIDRAIKMLNSSELLREAFKNWEKTGKGVEKYPLDPTDPKTWDKNAMTT